MPYLIHFKSCHQPSLNPRNLPLIIELRNRRMVGISRLEPPASQEHFAYDDAPIRFSP